MNATKRKFNALIQGLSNPSTPERTTTTTMAEHDDRHGLSASSSASDALILKRRRLGIPGAKPNVGDRGGSSSLPCTPFSSLRKTGSAINNNNNKASQLKPTTPSVDALIKYCPADRDQLLKRLATFQELTDWTPKPDRVNEVEWARRGWVCRGKEKVGCLLCHKELLVTINQKEVDGQQGSILVSPEIDEAVVDKYSRLILNSHQQDCLWRKRGCDESLLRLSFSSDRTVLANLRQRYDELCSRAAFLPYQVNLRLPAELDVDRVLSLLPPDFFADSTPSADEPTAVNRPALSLALLGWQGLTHPRFGSVPNSASCHSCLRRLGLWMFKSKEVADDGTVLVPAPMDYLDPLREHRFFCPWQSADVQSKGAKSAWTMLLQTMVNDASLRDLYEGRAPAPSTTTDAATSPSAPDAPSIIMDDEADEKARDAKDKERWARLRKVKSLFDTKGAKMLRRSVSINRPDAGQSGISSGA